MRRKDATGITINEENVPVDKFGHAPYIDFNSEESDIIILAYQPGIGKTHTILKFMEQNPSCFYFTDRHKVIYENTKKWDDKSIEYAHWEGFNRKCNNERFNNIVKNYKMSPAIACEHCQRTRCTYRGQFSHRDRVFAPFEYLSTNYVMGELPDFIILDESKVNVDTAYYNQEATIQWLENIRNRSTMPLAFITNIRSNNYLYFTQTRFNQLTQYCRDAQENAFETDNLEALQNICRINPYNLFLYFKFANIYHDFHRNNYYVPLWYHAFEVINRGSKVIYLDASFHKDWFKYLLECFNGEIGFNNGVSITIYYTNVTNHNTIIYNMKHDNTRASWTPKKSVRGYTRYWFPNHLKKIKEIYGEENVGLITFKEVSELKNPKYIELFDNQHFGNLRSSNAFVNKRVLVVLGTYFGTDSQIFEHLNKIFDLHDRSQIVEEEERRQEYVRDGTDGFLRPLDPNSLYNTILRPKRRRRYTDTNPVDYMGDGDREDYDNYVLPVLWLQNGIWDSEMYQAFHRNRGLQKNRIIFAYCWFPPELLKEFSVKSVEKSKSAEKEFWDSLEEQEIKNRIMDSFTNEINLADRPNLMKTYLSEKYRIFGKEDRDEIDEFITKYQEMKSKIKQPKK